MKYKVGDKVRIVDKRTDSMNPAGEMDEYLGSVMTVQVVLNKSNVYLMAEDNGEWEWHDDMIAGLVDTDCANYELCIGCYYYNYVDPNPPCEHCGHAEDGMNLYFITEKEYKSIHGTESAIESVCTHNGCEGCKHEDKPEYGDLNHPELTVNKLALLNNLITIMEDFRQIGVFTDDRKKRSFDITLEDLRDERIARFVKYIDWDEVEHRLNIAGGD